MELTPELLAQFEALTQGFKTKGNLGQLSPELLAFLTQQQAQDVGGSGLYRGFATPDGRTIQQYGNYADASPGASPDSQSYSRDPARAGWSGIDFMLNTDESNDAATFDQNGNFIGYERRQDDKDWRDFITAAAMIGGGIYGGGALSDWAAGAGAAGGTGGAAAGAGTDWAGWAAAEQSGALAGSGYTGSAFGAGEAAAGLGAAGGAAGGAGAGAGGAGTAGTGAAGAGGAGAGGAGGAGGAASAGKGLLDIFNTDGSLNYGKLAAGLFGAYTGYQDSKDKEQTQKVEPWGPAQPYLKGLLGEGADIYSQYKQQPFSPTEQTAYGNLGNTFDFINANAPGLMSGFNANASGQNQFVRGKPRSLIGNSYDPATSPVAWQPGLLGNFGTRK